MAAAAGVFAGLYGFAVIGAIVDWIGTVVVAWGGYRMYQGEKAGRRLVAYGLVIAFVLYYLVIISRFPDELKLVPSATP